MTEHRSKHWSQLLEAHRGWLSAVIFARVRDRDAVEEVLQETALAAVSGNRPADAAGLSRWLYRVAIRQSILYRRKAGRNGKKTNGYADSDRLRSRQESGPVSPYTILAASEQSDLVWRAMRQLTGADREMLLLKYTEHWSCQEVAARIGISHSAVKSRLLRARRNLRRELLRISPTWEVP